MRSAARNAVQLTRRSQNEYPLTDLRKIGILPILRRFWGSECTLTG